MRRQGTALVGGLLAIGLLSGCEAAQEITTPDPQPVADELAQDLADGAFTRTTFHGSSPGPVTQELEAVLEGMGDLQPGVSAMRLDESGDTTTVTLGWTWPFDQTDWVYEAEATLTLVEGSWQAEWSPAMVEPSLENGETLVRTTLSAERGGITGRRGLAIVTDRPVVRLGVDRSRVALPKAKASARRLAELLDIDVASYVKEVAGAGEAQFVEALVYRRDDVPASVIRGYDEIPGVLALEGELPLAPTREFAAPILGTVGEVTAEMIEEDPERYRIGDRAGISGLQARYEDQLGGTPGLVVAAVPKKDDAEPRELFRQGPVDGEDLELTLDVELQLVAERLLAGVGPASALVALRPSTGDVLVAANGPGANGYNIATFGQFAPGSTFKSVTTLALVRNGLTAADPVPCTDRIMVDGKAFENYDDYPASQLGRIPLRTALAHSCNTAFISQRDRLGDDDLADAAASLVLGVDHDLGFPAYFGNVVPPASETEAAADLIGQGKILASPMAMAAVIGSVQAGETVLPRLVPSYPVDQAEVPPLESGEASALREMLRGVVTSGSGSLLADVPGPPVIAKTGTAEFSADDGSLRTHAWMIGAQGDLAVAVFVEEGASGSSTAGPILEAFLRAAR